MKAATSRSYNAAELEKIETLTSAYVLGALDESSADFQEFDALLAAGDPYTAEMLEGFYGAATLLSEVAPQVDAPASVKASLMNNLSKYPQNSFSNNLIQAEQNRSAVPLERKLRTKNRTIIGLAVGGGLLCCLLLALNVMNSAKVDRASDLMKGLIHQNDSLRALFAVSTTDVAPTATIEETPVAMSGIDQKLVMPVISMFQEGSAKRVSLSTLTAPSHDVLYVSPKRKVVVLMRGALAPLDGGHTYQLWSSNSEGASRSIGTFSIDASNKQPLYAFGTDVKPNDIFTLTVEPKGGSRTKTGPVVLTSHTSKRTM